MSDLTIANIFIIGFPLIGLAFALYQFSIISAIPLESSEFESDTEATNLTKHSKEERNKVIDIYRTISEGADSFLRAEYTICCIFTVLFGIVLFFMSSAGFADEQEAASKWLSGFFTTVAFMLGAFTSMLSGWIGMRVAVFSNARTTIAAQEKEWAPGFNTAFRAGGVMGFALTSLGILVLYATLGAYSLKYSDSTDWNVLMDIISGYGLGGSSIAMFGRVGGGIYTKAADVGADLVGKVNNNLNEDDVRNPATIADNVGDNVGDVAGMGADLFGSFAESTCAALVIATAYNSDIDLNGGLYLYEYGWAAVMFPLLISASGIIVCMLCSFVATHISPVKSDTDVELVLKVQLIITTLIMIPVAYGLAVSFLPETFYIQNVSSEATEGHNYQAFICVTVGCIGGLLIGLITEYYTSHSYTPVRELAEVCVEGGAAINIIYGLALGYLSCILPVFILAIIIYVGFDLLDMYGVALGAIGMLSTLATGLTIDAYGPVCDNAGGIAEMAFEDEDLRAKTDTLDAAGNTTAAIGKGFAIGSAALVSLALFGAFVVRCGDSFDNNVPLLDPLTFAFLMIGANLPYWFSALTMKSVGRAANAMVEEVKRQFTANPELLHPNSDKRPDYDRCIKISTQASLKEMIAPALLVMLAPLITGIFFGVSAVCGLLAGGLSSGVQLAISMSNTGGAWDNAKKYVEKGTPDQKMGKGSDAHKAAVVGDTVGDPLKDTSGPALNILMKLMAILSLVFATFFKTIHGGNGLFFSS